MIRPRHAIKLARTKLLSKRAILYSSIIVSSILFAALIAGVIVYTGASKSAVAFVQKANGNRYLVTVNPVVPSDVISFGQEPSLSQIREIEAFQTQYYGAIQAQYKKLGLTYDASTEIPALTPSSYKPATLPIEQRVDVNYRSPVITALLKQKYDAYVKTAPGRIDNLEKTAKKYRGSGFYISENSGLPDIPGARLVQNSKEDFGDSDVKAGNQSEYGYFINAIHNGFYSFSDTSLLSRYLLTKSASSLKGVPVIVSAQEAASLFGAKDGIGSEPKGDTQKITWLQQVQSKLNNTTYQVCYRNSAEQAMLNKIQSDYADSIINADNKDYQKPDLTYGYPTTPCGDVVITSDTRTAVEKAAAADAVAVQQKLGTYQAPSHRLVTFQIVGFINAQPYISTTTNVSDYLKNLITVNNLTDSAIIPTQLYQSLPQSLKVDDLITSQDDTDNALVPRVVSFPTIQQAEAFIDNEACPLSDSSCMKAYNAGPYGSNYLILDQLGSVFRHVATVALPVALVLALIIIWFTVSRIMAENRKETAVYRAMGARRGDIGVIYLTYVVLVAARIALLSIILGVVAAYVVQYLYGNTLNNIALASFGSVDSGQRFSLFDVSSPLSYVIVGMILLTCVIASVPSLIRNALRPPISDLKND